MNQCLCGCGKEVLKNTSKYIRGHATRGKSSWNKGIEWSDDIKKKFSIAQRKRKPNTFLGRHHTEETKKKIIESLEKTKIIRSEKISKANRGKKRSLESRENISLGHKGLTSWIKGKTHSLESRKKISESNKGKILSNETKLKIRLAHLKIIQEKFFNGESVIPCIGNKEKEFSNFLFSNYSNFEIISQFKTKCGYFIDCYIPSINIAFEFDEKHHESLSCKKYDSDRQKLIEDELNCLFYRVKEQDWDNDKSKVISEVLSFLEQNIKEK